MYAKSLENWKVLENPMKKSWARTRAHTTLHSREHTHLERAHIPGVLDVELTGSCENRHSPTSENQKPFEYRESSLGLEQIKLELKRK